MRVDPLRRWRALAGDRRAAIAPLAALTFLALAAFGALAVDAGSFYYGKRRQQGATDLAAMAAAADVARAGRAAAATLVANGFAASDVLSVEPGTYIPDPALAAPLRFTPANANANAVRLTTRSTLPVYFGRLLSDASAIRVEAHATAARSDLASFSIGSRVAALDGGVANAVTSALLGTSVRLSVADYQSLAAAKVDLFDFGQALATRLSLSGPTYDQVASANLRVADVLSAALEAGRSGGASSAALSALGQLARAKTGSADAMNLSALLDFGPLGRNQVGAKPFAASASISDILAATLQIANGSRQVELALPVGVPPLASASLRLAIGERPVGRSAFVFGVERASAFTAQIRLLLTVQVGGAGLVPSVSLPIYLDVAQSQATLSAISCNRADIRSTSVTLAVTPGLVDGWIGDVAPGLLSNFTAPPNPGPATLVNVAGLATVRGRAHAQIASTRPVSLTFGYADIQAVTKKTTSTTDFVASLLAGLLGDLKLDVAVLGLGLGLPAIVNADTVKAVSAATAPVDTLVASLLSTLGLGLGQADSWVDGVRCGGIVLVD